MDRRSFIMTLIGGMAAAGLGGIAVAEAAPVAPVPTPEPAPRGDQLAAETAEGLDKTDAEFSQYYYRRRYRPRYYRRPRAYYRPRYYARPRYYRPRRRVYFY